VASRATSITNTWNNVWLPFCEAHHLSSTLDGIHDPVPILLVFAYRYRSGDISKSGLPVRADTVSDALLHVAQTFTGLGLPDPRANCFGATDTRLQKLYTAWRNADPAPKRCKPIPIQILRHAQAIASAANTPHCLAIIDLAWLAYFFLLRPGEYCCSSDSLPLRLNSIQLLHDTTEIPHLICPLGELDRANYVKLTFDNQKNRIRGEIVAHGRSGDPIACPVATVIRRVTHLRQHGANHQTPLYQYVAVVRWNSIRSDAITATLRRSALCLGNALGIKPADINARALRSGGAMALLCAKVDPHLIQMVGRWRSDAMFRYLHLQATPLIGDLSHRMLTGGTFTLLPDQDVPAAAAEMLLQVPVPDPIAP
jgi:hypothetical protein